MKTSFAGSSLRAEVASEIGRPVPRVDDAAMLRLVAWDWPGNVRELANAVQRMVVMAEGILACKACPKRFRRLMSRTTPVICKPVRWRVSVGTSRERSHTPNSRVDQREPRANGQLLGLGERTLYRKLKEYGLR